MHCTMIKVTDKFANVPDLTNKVIINTLQFVFKPCTLI